MLLNFIVQMGTVVSNMAWSADKSFLLYFQPEEEFHPSDFSPLKKGLLWQQRDKLFSRWKERYFVLTKDYFHCFKKATSKITEMGGFIFKVRNLLLVNLFFDTTTTRHLTTGPQTFHSILRALLYLASSRPILTFYIWSYVLSIGTRGNNPRPTVMSRAKQ